MNTNHLRRLLYVGVAAMALMLAATAGATTIKIATIVPDGAFWMTEMRRAAAEIDTRTEGRVKIKFYPGGVMGNNRSVLRKIRVGQLDGGAFTGGGLSDVYADLSIYSIPFLFPSEGAVDYVRARIDPVLKDGLQKAGFASFGFAGGGFAYLFSQHPVDTLGAMKGKKIWAPEGDELLYAAMERLGLSPVALPTTDVLTGLQTGLLDVVGTSPIGAVAFQWYTKVGYMTDASLSYLYAMVAITEKTMEKLSASDRAVMEEVMGATYDLFDKKNRTDDHEALQALKKEGIQLVPPAPGQIDEWRSVVRASADAMAADGKFSAELYHRIIKLVEEHRAGQGGAR